MGTFYPFAITHFRNWYIGSAASQAVGYRMVLYVHLGIVVFFSICFLSGLGDRGLVAPIQSRDHLVVRLIYDYGSNDQSSACSSQKGLGGAFGCSCFLCSTLVVYSNCGGLGFVFYDTLGSIDQCDLKIYPMALGIQQKF